MKLEQKGPTSQETKRTNLIVSSLSTRNMELDQQVKALSERMVPYEAFTQKFLYSTPDELQHGFRDVPARRLEKEAEEQREADKAHDEENDEIKAGEKP